MTKKEIEEAKQVAIKWRVAGRIKIISKPLLQTIQASRKVKKIKNPTAIKKMGRPSLTGLSVKELGGPAAYARALWRLRHPNTTRIFTGIDWKKLGHAEGMRQYRALKKAR